MTTTYEERLERNGDPEADNGGTRGTIDDDDPGTGDQNPDNGGTRGTAPASTPPAQQRLD